MKSSCAPNIFFKKQLSIISNAQTTVLEKKNYKIFNNYFVESILHSHSVSK